MSARVYTEEQLQERMAEIVQLGRELQGPSLAERLGTLDESALEGVSWQHAANDWEVWGRPKQLVLAEPKLPAWWPAAPWVWRIALFLAGRATGKTRTGAESAWHRIERGHARSLLFIGATWRDVRRTMVGGLANTTSGFLDILPPHVRAQTEWNKNDGEIHVRSHGATVYLGTAEDTEQRGGNFDYIWGDEPIKWRRLQEVLDNLSLALRDPRGACQMLLTTTPKRQKWLEEMLMDRRVLVIHGTTHENASNIHPEALADWKRKYAGTRVGRQEMGAELLGDNDKAITTSAQIEADRIIDQPVMVEVGVGLDPTVSAKRKSDEAGIVAVGRTSSARLILLEDRTEKLEPTDHKGKRGWADEAVRCAIDWGATFIIYEENKIGLTGLSLLREAVARADMTGKIGLRKAYSIKDKRTRAIALSAAYDRGEVHHLGRHPDIETQLTQYDADDETQASPNNLDAFVHVANAIMGWASDKAPVDHGASDGLGALNKLFEVDRTQI